MVRGFLCCASLVLVLGLALAGPAGAELVGWWTCDEGQGTTVSDSTGNGSTGTFNGDPEWIEGQLDGALDFDGDGDWIEMDTADALAISGEVTIAGWIKLNAVGLDQKVGGNQDDATGGYKLTVFTDNKVEFEVRDASNASALTRNVAGGTVLEAGVWYHVAGVYSEAEGYARTYVNGVLDRDMATTTVLSASVGPLRVGCEPFNTGGYNFNGAIDDLRIYNHAVTAEELSVIMLGGGALELAADPSPADEATDVALEAVLNWTAGEFAATHDVYVGTSFDDVNNASRTNPLGVLVISDQSAASFDPDGLLDIGQTYYWRVDEVNAAPDYTVFKGDVWSFTTEPVAYPVTAITATASSAHSEDMGPEKTVDGSGLNASDEHSTLGTDMWLSAGSDAGPVWIQYEFDRAYTLHQMLVWNSNQPIEAFVGFGAQSVSVEYSQDGAEWVVLEGATAFAQAAGVDAYAANTAVDFGDAMVRFVKITINDNWGMLTQSGLSEVRFLYIPVQAREPQPAADAVNVDLDVVLSWRLGRGAVSHDVYFSTDEQAVIDGTAPVVSVTDGRYDSAAFGLEYGTTYYWKVNEIDADGVAADGEIWSFTTVDHFVVDDMETYTDDEGSRIYETWIDGWDNGTGATVGYLTSPFAEQSIVNGGSQSLPLDYNNVNAPWYSETSQSWDTPQNWTGDGVTDLTVHFRGNAVGFLEKADGSILMGAAGADIWGAADEFRFAYKRLNGDGAITVKVDSVGATNVWAKAGVMIRESLAAGARNAFAAVTPGSGVAFQQRVISDSDSTNVAEGGLAAPYWVRLTRSGDSITAQRSADGVTWEPITADPAASTVEIPMIANVYIGLALTSHVAGTSTTTEFSNVSTTGGVTGQWETEEVGVAQPSNDPGQLYVAVEDSAGNVAVVNHPNADVLVNTVWQQWDIPLSEFTGVNMAKVASLTIGVGDRDNPTPGGAGLLYVDDIQVARRVIPEGPADVTAPGNIIKGLPNDADWPAGELPLFVIDNDVNTKFLHFKGSSEPTGFSVTPGTAQTIVTGLTVTTANDAPERDPVSFELYGSNDGIDGPYTLIAGGDIVDFSQEVEWGRFSVNATPITFENEVAYDHYQVVFTAIRDAAAANSMQVAEVELIGGPAQ